MIKISEKDIFLFTRTKECAFGDEELNEFLIKNSFVLTMTELYGRGDSKRLITTRFRKPYTKTFIAYDRGSFVAYQTYDNHQLESTSIFLEFDDKEVEMMFKLIYV